RSQGSTSPGCCWRGLSPGARRSPCGPLDCPGRISWLLTSITPVVIMPAHVAELHLVAFGRCGIVSHRAPLEHLHQHIAWLPSYLHARPERFGNGIARDIYPVPRLLLEI